MNEKEEEILEWVKYNPELNFQANPTRAIQAVVHEAYLQGVHSRSKEQTMDPKYEWIIKEKVWAQQSPPPTPGNILVYNYAGTRAVVISVTEDHQLLFNDEYCDVGDDLAAYLSVMDEAIEHFPKKVLSEPYGYPDGPDTLKEAREQS